MRKQIDGSTKYETVRQIEAGKISIRHAAEQLGVHPSSVQAWVRLYETEGISGFAKQKNQVYSEALKVKAVEDYLSGKGSLAAICKKYKIRARIQLQDWIKVYNAHGDFNSRKRSGGGSYMRKARSTRQEERVQIVKACLKSGKNYGEMALKYNVSYQQVRSWTQKFEELGEAGLEDRRGKRKKDQEPRTELEAAQIEIEQLKHKLYLAEMERDLLKNWTRSRGEMPFGSETGPNLWCDPRSTRRNRLSHRDDLRAAPCGAFGLSQMGLRQAESAGCGE